MTNAIGRNNLQAVYDFLGYTDTTNPFQKNNLVDFYLDQGDFLEFDQSEFFNVDFETSKDFAGKQAGKIFIPHQCRSDVTCKVHLAFNRQNASIDVFPVNKRYNNMGALNDIIMVYPYSKSWDIRGDLEKSRYGTLASGVHKIIQRLTGGEDTCEEPLNEANQQLDSIESYLARETTAFDRLDLGGLAECDTQALEERRDEVIDSLNYKAYLF